MWFALQGSGTPPRSLALNPLSPVSRASTEAAGMGQIEGMKEAAAPVMETPLIGSGSQEEADKRVLILLDMGTSRGFLTYEELNDKLPDEVVSADKLDSLLMKMDEMGIKLVDEAYIGE